MGFCWVIPVLVRMTLGGYPTNPGCLGNTLGTVHVVPKGRID
jgi:hypothetical protein